MSNSQYSHYNYDSAEKSHAHNYLWPVLKKLLRTERTEAQNLFDLGCGNGSTANMLAQLGWNVTGIDQSETGIAQARRSLRTDRGFRLVIGLWRQPA